MPRLLQTNVSTPRRQSELTLGQIEELARKARWEVRQEDARAHRSRCMDGRYKPGAGIIAMPGADVGLLAVGLAALRSLAPRYGKSISPGELCELVFAAAGGPKNFSYHTDRASFTRDHDRYDGCSYCRLLASNPKLFGPYALGADQLDLLQGILSALETEHVKPDILRGGHDECAVLIVQNVRSLSTLDTLGPEELERLRKLWVLDNYAVLRGLGRRRVFVFQRDLAHARVHSVARALAQALRADAEESREINVLLHEIAKVHFGRALEHLALGLPIYNVFVDAGTGDIAGPERARTTY